MFTLQFIDIRHWQHHCQVHRKVDQLAHFARPTDATSVRKFQEAGISFDFRQILRGEL